MSEAHRLTDLRDRGGPAQPLLLVRDLKKYFPAKRHLLAGRREMVQAVDGVSFTVMKGTTLGIVGESGCGKSTTARLLLHLIEPDTGDIVFVDAKNKLEENHPEGRYYMSHNGGWIDAGTDAPEAQRKRKQL